MTYKKCAMCGEEIEGFKDEDEPEMCDDCEEFNQILSGQAFQVRIEKEPDAE